MFPSTQIQIAADTDSSSVAHVMRVVNNHIRSNRLKPGMSILGETSFAAEAGVSRAVVREAFQSLAALGIIEIGNGRKPRVGLIDHNVLPLVIDHAVQTDQVSIQQIYDVRRTIEMRTVGLAALRRTEQEATEISDLGAAMRKDLLRPHLIMEHDIAFHEAIATASRNPLFALIVSAFHVVTRQTWQISWAGRRAEADRLAIIACHQQIAAAIETRDAPAAETAMAEHFDSSVKVPLEAGVI